jgi:hypothetical protein
MGQWKIGEENRSSTYILPMLGKFKSDFWVPNMFPKSMFRNCFVGDRQRPELVNKILLLYEFKGDRLYTKMEEDLFKHKQYAGTYDPDPMHTMYIFDVPVEHIHNYKMYLHGAYSKFDKDYKTHILKFHGLTKGSMLNKILHKEEEGFKHFEELYGIKIPRSQEVGSMPNWEEEYYKEEYKVVKAMDNARGNFDEEF